MSLIHNEQTKLMAAWLNGIAIAAVALGGIAPFAAVIAGSASLATALVSAIIWFTFGST